ncbi:MAG: endo-1,4-beta-xylanase [Cyanobacteria bacterium Co-bin8]|nr:endo-1,4-beta-xylanase [Cyanobacteria bacterium Co-bin8]
MKRRQFLAGSAGGLALTQLHPASAFWPSADLTLRAWLPEGQPLPVDQLRQLYFLDLQDEPLPNPPRAVAPGHLKSQAPTHWPVAIALRMSVSGFGQVALYADNRGQGFLPSDFPLSLNEVFARDRIHRVQTALTQWRQAGHTFAARIEARLAKASQLLEQAAATDSLPAQVRLWNDSLVESLWAGEESAIARAQQRIQQRPPRQEFLFGCNFFGHPHQGDVYDQRFRQIFNFATVPFYWQGFEPVQGDPQYAPIDRQVAWLRQAGIMPKGHPLVWFHDVSVPDWLRDLPYPEVKGLVQRRVRQIIQRYGSQIPYYDVINEAHDVPWANALNFSADQFLDLTQAACEAAQQGYSQVNRIVNSCCLWAQNVAYNGPPQRSPYRYLRACLDAGIEFETIGLQLYYPDQDMFEIDRLLDRFAGLGKPLHITEMATSSNSGVDEQSQLQEARGLWHAPWSESVQADWVEQIYTLGYSKPEVQAITWWDFSDLGVFWPFGGLLDRDLQPKEAFERLRHLLRSWQVPHVL